MTKRQTRTFRGGEIIDITEYHDGQLRSPWEKENKEGQTHPGSRAEGEPDE